MLTVKLLQPQKVVFGPGCAVSCMKDLIAAGYRRAFIATSAPILTLVDPFAEVLRLPV